MDYNIELYRGPDFKFFDTVPFMPVVRESLKTFLKWDLSRTLLQISVVAVPEDSYTTGMPMVTNLIPEFGYAYVKVVTEGVLMYQHPHPLYDLVTRTLQAYLKDKYPDVAEWKYRIDIPGIPRFSSMRPAPQVEGGIYVRPYEFGTKPGFTIRRLAEAKPPVKTLADFGITAEDDKTEANVKVLVSQQIENDICRFRPFSPDIEEGGFLIGRVFQEGEQDNRYLLEITEALNATHTGASLLHFTFTGDSFAEVKRTLSQRRPNDRILGWYHTHLFPASSELGLSSIDLTLHFGTFTIPWQIAGLINIDGNKRTLRFYVRNGNMMVLCPYWVIHERS